MFPFYRSWRIGPGEAAMEGQRAEAAMAVVARAVVCTVAVKGLKIPYVVCLASSSVGGRRCCQVTL